VRTDAFLNGTYRNLNYNLSGGGDNYGVFFSLGADDDEGTLPHNEYGHINTRANFDFFAREDLRLEFGFGLARVLLDLPQNDNNIYGYLGGGLLGDPRTVGGSKDGWYAPNRHVLAIAAIQNVEKTWRIQPHATVNYSPVDWFNNRVTVGADMVRSEASLLYSKNDETWYDNVDYNAGRISQRRDADDHYTLEYLGTFTRNLTDNVRVDWAVGTQWLADRSDQTNAQGTGLINNDVKSVNAAAELSNGGQSSSESRTVGIFSQADISWREVLYMQLGVRRDESSTFGVESKPFYSPKIGLSYVISDEDYFNNMMEFLPEGALTQLRLRGAFGVSGRQPTSGARSTYSPSSNQISATDVAIGVRPNDNGNAQLRAEKSQELELGFDAGFWNDRLGMEVTYFNKKGIDQIIQLPVPGSQGSEGPRMNVGSILNKGFEATLDARVITMDNVALELRASANTLTNEVLDLGPVPESTTRKVGYPLNGAWEYEILDVDVANNVVTVSDERVFLGNGADYPGWEMAFSGTLTLFQNLTFYAQMDGRGDHSIYNSTDQFRDRSFGIGEVSHRGCLAYGETASGECTPAAVIDYMSRYGPFARADGTTVSRGSVDGNYRQTVSTYKLREASVSYRIPAEFVRNYIRARSASFGVTMRNIHTWTNYLGLDPETDQFLSVPQDKRWTARFTVTF